MAIKLGDIYIGNYPMSQGFGLNPDKYKPFGFNGHEGIDIACPTGTPIISATDGVVCRDTDDPKVGGYGDYVVVWDQIQNCSTWYGHLRENVVQIGQRVVKGQLLGYSDNSGNSTGPHLHFGIRKCDEQGNAINTDNGYKGFINPNDKRVVEWVITNPTKPVDPNPIITPVPADGLTEDERHALSILKSFKASTQELSNGNLEGAINALVGTYKDLQAAKQTIETMTREAIGTNDQVKTLNTFKEDLAIELNCSNQIEVIKAEVKKLVDLETTYTDPQGQAFNNFIQALLNLFKKK